MTKYRIQVDTQKGRGLFATSTIYPGEIILEEDPLISSQFLWNAEYKYDSCNFCLRPLETAQENVQRLCQDGTIQLPYHESCCATDKSKHVLCVCGARYCSAQCRQQASIIYHTSLCPADSFNPPELAQAIAKLCDLWKSIHYPPESASIMLIVRLLAAIKQSNQPQEIIAKLNQFKCNVIEDSEKLAHKLLGDKFQMQISSLKEMVRDVIYDSCLDPFFTDYGFTCLLALIGRNGQGIGTSPFCKWAKNCEQLVANNPTECNRINELIESLFDKMDHVSGPFLNNDGSGLFELHSTINHSCEPNAEVHFLHNNHHLSLKAVELINADEEIFICYIDECQRNRSRHSRLKYLRENYLFTCQCRKCQQQANEPDVTSDEDGDQVDGGDRDSDLYSDAEDMNCDG